MSPSPILRYFEYSPILRYFEYSPILRYFEYLHLPMDLAVVSGRFYDLAHIIEETLPAGPEKSTALRKLLEAKDAAVRAALEVE